LREDLLRWKAAEDLVEPVDANVAGRRFVLRGAAVLDGVAGGFCVGELLDIGGDFVAEAGGEEFVAELGELRGRDSLRSICRPAQLIAKGCGMREGRRLHDFEILFVLYGGAGGHLIEPLASVGLQAAEAIEGGEELVMAVDALGGDEGAHGEAVDEVVVESLILEGRGNGDFSRIAVVGHIAKRLDEANGILALGRGGSSALDGGDAEAFARGFGDEGLSIDRTGEMHVQIGALGKHLEKSVEFAGAHRCGRIHGASGVDFARSESGGGRGLSNSTTERRADEETESDMSANHAQRPFQCIELSKDTAAGDGVWR
jgi:hypothetical protein